MRIYPKKRIIIITSLFIIWKANQAKSAPPLGTNYKDLRESEENR